MEVKKSVRGEERVRKRENKRARKTNKEIVGRDLTETENNNGVIFKRSVIFNEIFNCGRRHLIFHA